MRHCTLLCFIFIKSVAVFTELLSDPAVHSELLLSLPAQHRCILLHPQRNRLPALIITKSGPYIPVCAGPVFQCTWLGDKNAFLSLTFGWSSSSPPSFWFTTQDKWLHCVCCRLVVRCWLNHIFLWYVLQHQNVLVCLPCMRMWN